MDKPLDDFMQMMFIFFQWLASLFLSPPDYESKPDDQKSAGTWTICDEIFNSRCDWAISERMPSHVIHDPDVQLLVHPNPFKLMFNLYIWTRLHRVGPTDYAFSLLKTTDFSTYHSSESGCVYAPKDLIAEFKEWQSAYEARFPTSGKELLPTLPDSYILSGTVIAHSGAKVLQSQGFLDLLDISKWIWIVQNCNGRVWVTDSSFIFEDDADAVLYKLTEEK